MQETNKPQKPFIGRQLELEKLTQIYQTDNFEFGVVYGRRRIGKSTLLKSFIKDKPSIYLVANEKKLEFNLENFAREVGAFVGQTHIKFSSFSDMLDFLFTNISEKTIIIIDEFTYLVETEKAVLSELQNAVDKYKDNSRLKLIISGSHVGMVEDMIAYKKPLYARKTFAIKLGEFDYFEAAEFFPNFSPEDRIRAYSFCGGVPYYLSLVDDTKSIRENIIDMFVRPFAHLENELDFIFQTEFRSKVNYSSVLQVVANGKTKLNEISQISHINDTAKTATYLKPLIDMGIVQKERAFADSQQTRKTIYKLKNNLVNFMYSFLEDNKSAHGLLSPQDFYEIIIEPKLDQYVSFIFEEVCKQYLIRTNKMPGSEKILEIGRYWYNCRHTKSQIEIDICTKTTKGVIAYECKWTNSQIDMAIMLGLWDKAQAVDEISICEIGAFSKSGFTPGVTEKYKRIFTPKDLF